MIKSVLLRALLRGARGLGYDRGTLLFDGLDSTESHTVGVFVSSFKAKLFRALEVSTWLGAVPMYNSIHSGAKALWNLIAFVCSGKTCTTANGLRNQNSVLK